MPFPTPGQPFGRYLVEVLLARGGMGSVFRALDTETGKHVAVKVLREDRLESQDEDAARFLREGRIASKLEHPNIVAIHEVGEVDGVPFLAMEWVDGLPLSETIRGGLSPEAQHRLLLEIAEALTFAHEHAIIHRDVKPANVLVDADGKVKLVDFGIARHAEPSLDPATFETRANMILGTPSYMAPEQMASSKVTTAADQFAWGVLAYEVMTGSHPRDVVPGFPFHAPKAEFWRTDVPEKVGRVVRRATSLDPALRFESMQALVVAWREALTEDTLKTVAHRSLSERPRDHAAVPKVGPSRRLGRAAMVATLVAGLGFGAFILPTNRPRSMPIAGTSSSLPSAVTSSATRAADASDATSLTAVADASAAVPRAEFTTTPSASARAARRTTTRAAESERSSAPDNVAPAKAVVATDDPLKDIERR
ncbi:Serine/threonine protein kinase PpkA [Labilithrix luteola]|uniref:Serine/threonine protein kinase PpkA n=1 Tax=Labilithrix luteola TaxID=1391654 RepID=A0A0K1PNL6_9BACT|nr:serine/threonine-protein kinase [Labilithrix luteola]AKU94699.1 Serine/threonine protein kinase PpkA [Labilithrix luteola]